MIGAPGQCECRCHIDETIKDCKCGCQLCRFCNKHFVVGLIKYHEMICEPYFKQGLDKVKKDEKHCGC